MVGLRDVQIDGDSVGGNRREELNELIAAAGDFRDAALRSPIVLERKIAKLLAGEFRIAAHIEAGNVVGDADGAVPSFAVIDYILWSGGGAYAFEVAPDIYSRRKADLLSVRRSVFAVALAKKSGWGPSRLADVLDGHESQART